MSDASPSVPARPSLAAVPRPAEESVEPLSFEDFYRKEHRHVLGLAFVLTGNRSAAEDVAQDAFTAAFRQWRSVAVCDAPGAWIRRVTCHRAASVLRRRLVEAKALVRLAKRTPAPSSWKKVTRRSGRPSVVFRHGKHRRSLSTTSRTTACATSPRSWTAAKAP